MFEQDYIIRLIREMIRTILKLLFHIDTDSPTADLLEDEGTQAILNGLLDMIDQGNINEAENRIFDLTADNNMTDLEMALLFYSYLNEKEDDFLLEHDFSREEVKLGIEDLASRYGLAGISDIFGLLP